jgi:hypothetical protein
MSLFFVSARRPRGGRALESFCGSSFLLASNRWTRTLAKPARVLSALTLAAIVLGGHSASAATPTVTSLNLSSGSVSAGTASIFTATVTSAVTGSVTFCNANATFCTGSNLLQQVQVTAAGTASFRKVFGAGTYSVKAIFSGTTALASSSSSAVSLTVTGNGSYATETSIVATGNPGSYTLAGTVAASGRILPNGSVGFLDTTASSAQVATSALDPATHGFNFTSFPTSSLSSFSVAAGDFNEDGKLDLVGANGGLQIALGNGDGTFAAPTSYAAVSNTRYVAVYDINGDGHLDVIALGSNNQTTYQSYLAVLLGNGDGTFQAAQTFYAGHESLGLALGDFNGDGIADIVTANAGIDNTVGVFLGYGNGTFHARVTYPVAAVHSVSVGDVNGDGHLDLIASTATGISVLLGAGDGTFATAVAHAGGSISEQAVGGDFNADGKLDVATANFGSSNMTVFLGNGDGTFQPAVAYVTNFTPNPQGSDPISITSGDFNGDGIEDLAVGANNEGSTYFLGNGDGTFQPLGALNTVDSNSIAQNWGIVSGDFDGDGLDDLAVAEWFDGVTVVLLAQQTVVATSTGVSVPGPAAQQVDASYPGDAEHVASVSSTVPLLPLASAVSLAASPGGAVPGAPVTLTATITPTPTGPGSAGTVSFYNGSTLLSTVNVTGSTAVYVTTTLPAGYSNISAAYSGNIVLAPSTSSSLRIFIGGQTSIALTLSATTAAAPAPITLTATATELPGGASLTPGQVTFQYQQTAGSVTIPGSFGSVQLSSAGTATVVAVPSAGAYEVTAVFSGTATEGPSSSAAQALTISGNGSYATATTLVASGSIGDYTLAATVTGFGVAVQGSLVSFLDTTAANAGIATATLDPLSVVTAMLPTSGSPRSLANAQMTASGDLNGDGIADLVSATCGGPGSGAVSVQLGVGDGTFQPAVPYPVSCLAVVAIGDVNGDGKPDLIAVSQTAGTVSILLGSGNGTFTLQPNPLQVGSNFPNAQPDAIAVADLNEDGKLDIVVANGAETDVAVFLGNGDGTFGAEQLFAVGNGANSVAIADLNGDGAPDLMVANQGDGTISVLLGSGNGTFQTQTTLTYPYGDSAGLLATGSLRGNGVIDLIAPDLYDPSVFIYLGNNDGTFAAPVGLNLNVNSGMAAAVADLNHDGKLDLAVSTFGEIGVFYGVGDGTFAAETDYSTGQASGQGYVAIIAADLNNDGLIDLITTDSVDNTQAFLLGQQSATATASAVYVTGSGAQVVDASFPGDGAHAASVSNTVPLQPSVQSASSTSLATGNANIATGSMATFTATVTPIPTGASYGTIGFYNGGVLLGTEPVNASGIATYSTSALPAGADAITAVYSGNATSALSTSGVVTETVKTSTSTNLSASTVSATSGQPVTLSATVTPASTDTMRGTVSFYAGSTLLGSSPLSPGGTATLSTRTLPLGTDTVTAVYSGSSDFAGSTSNGLAIAVGRTATATLVTSSTAAPAYGNSFTLTATVTPATTDSPAGTVSFYHGTTLLGTGAASAGGIATLSVTLTTLGANAITALYSGSVNFSPSTSNPLSLTVVRAATATVVTSSNLNPAYGAAITLTATVAPASTDTPPGMVSFYTGSTLLGTAALDPGGVASLGVSALTSGLNLITAVYSGSVDFAGSTSVSLSVSTGLTTATVVASSTATPVYGQAFTLTATVTPASTDTTPGTVRFYSGSVLLGSSPVSAAGVATLSASLLMVGPGVLTAVYSGSARYASSTSAALSITVVAAASSTAVSASNLAPALGQTVTLNATVTSTSAVGAGGIPGTVSFYSGSTLLGSTPLAGSVASLSAVLLPLGPNAVTAVYAGSADYAGSASPALSVSVRTNTTVTFSASPTTQLYNNPIMLTAQVSAAVGGVPTGTVTFLDGTTAVATAPVGPGGQVTYSDSTLADGSHSLTAAYSGNTSFLPSVSSGAPVAITVGNLNLALGGDKNKTVVPGGAVTYNFPLSPLVTPTFLYVVHLTASGLPPGATYTFTPASIPAGRGPIPVAFTVQTAAQTVTGRPMNGRPPWFALAFALLLPLAGVRSFRARLRAMPRTGVLALVATLGLGAALGLGGCGSGGFLGTPKGQTVFTITITATSADLVRTGTVQLNLE